MTARALLAEARTIARRLNGSVAHGAHQGDRYEREVCGKQMADAARMLTALAAAIEAQPDSEAADDALFDAARALLESRSSTFKARNGRDCGIQDEHGEKMWIVPFEEMLALEDAVEAAADAARGEPREGDSE